MSEVEGRVALVMAGTKGLGRASAEALGRSGHRVMICARTGTDVEAAVHEMRSLGMEVDGVTADVSRAEDVEAAVAATTERFGRLDVLVANAGGPPAGAFMELGDERWLGAFNLTFMSAVRAIRSAVPHMRRNGFGRIVVIGSSSVKQPIHNLALSNAFRPALLGVVKTLAQELAGDGITANIVSAGRIDTDRVRSLDEGRARAQGLAYDDVRANAEKAIPMRRYGQPAELGELIDFLASEAAGYITGQSILVDGGMVSAL